jgi:hypothetical protein
MFAGFVLPVVEDVTMRFHRATFIFILPLLTFAVAAGQGQTDHGTPPAPWFRMFGAEGFYLGVDKEEKHQGKASAFIKAVPSKMQVPALSCGLQQMILAEKYRGKRLRMTAYAKSKDVELRAALYLDVASKDKVHITVDNMFDRPIKGTTDWKKYELVLDIPDEAYRISFGFFLNGRKGQVWADDFSFEVVGKDVKTTKQKNPEPSEHDVLKQDVPPLKEPTNLDFEK